MELVLKLTEMFHEGSMMFCNLIICITVWWQNSWTNFRVTFHLWDVERLVNVVKRLTAFRTLRAKLWRQTSRAGESITFASIFTSQAVRARLVNQDWVDWVAVVIVGTIWIWRWTTGSLITLLKEIILTLINCLMFLCNNIDHTWDSLDLICGIGDTLYRRRWSAGLASLSSSSSRSSWIIDSCEPVFCKKVSVFVSWKEFNFVNKKTNRKTQKSY